MTSPRVPREAGRKQQRCGHITRLLKVSLLVGSLHADYEWPMPMDWARHAWTPGALLCALCCRQTPGARQRASRRRLLPGSGVSSRRGRRMRGHHDELHFVHGHPEAAKPVTPHKSSLTKCNARTGPLRVQSTAFEAHLNNTETIGERRETPDANFDCRCIAGCCAGWLRNSTGTGLLRRGLLPSWVLLLIRTGSRSMRDTPADA